MSGKCNHLFTEEDYKQTKDRLDKVTEERCANCDVASPHLWACLQKCCLFIGCGKQEKDHIGEHCMRNKHHMSLCLKDLQVWCLTCGTKLHDNEESLKQGESSPTEKDKTIIKSGGMDEIEVLQRPRGLCGLSNIGNSCYMNSAVQALSNCPPLTQFFLKCDGFLRVQESGRPNVAIVFAKLIQGIWDGKRPKYLVPTAFSKSFKSVYSQFRGYGQQDSQEFLRCLMDRLHEELKRPLMQQVVRKTVAYGQEQSNHHGTKLLGGNRIADSMDVAGSDDDLTINEKTFLNPATSSIEEATTDDEIANSSATFSKKRKTLQYHSIITDIFDGKLLSSVQCLTCNRVSNKVETFQDLSLPIPGKDDLAKIHAPGSPVVLCSTVDSGWISTMWDWFKSWFVGPQVTLQDCLAAFFASDELKGDNMYNCDKCNKLRNGVKYSRVQTLPEVLCIHLKRFRHEMYFSSKISSFVSFPITGLDMMPFLTKDCPSKVAAYDLTAVITHFGNVGVGHYVAYAKNGVSGKWYEFSDSFVSEVSEYSVACAEAYVLFYTKRGEEASRFCRTVYKQMGELDEADDEELTHRYISKEWFVRFSNCQEPGPITNGDILCYHGAIHPANADKVDNLVVAVPRNTWEILVSRFGGGPEVQSLSDCAICKELRDRRRREMDTFSKLHDEFRKESDPDSGNCLSVAWYKRWNTFVNGDDPDPPGPINNAAIAEIVNGQLVPRQDSEYGLISVKTWQYLHSIYGGGPEVSNAASPELDEGNIDKENGMAE